MGYLIAAVVMTLSVPEGHSLIASLILQVRYFIFVALHTVPLHLQSFLCELIITIFFVLFFDDAYLKLTKPAMVFML